MRRHHLLSRRVRRTGSHWLCKWRACHGRLTGCSVTRGLRLHHNLLGSLLLLLHLLRLSLLR
jgi:hypothetical protein